MCDVKERAIKDDANYFGVNKWKDAIDIYWVQEDLRWVKFRVGARLGVQSLVRYINEGSKGGRDEFASHQDVDVI